MTNNIVYPYQILVETAVLYREFQEALSETTIVVISPANIDYFTL